MRIKFFLFVLFSIILSSCVSEKEEGVIVSDATLYSLALNGSSFLYFENSTDTLLTDNTSSHISFVRVRFNPKARAAMNDSVNMLSGSSFPDESMIVKEVYDQKGGPLKRFAIMYKLRNAANNGSGWVWAELDPDGTPSYSAALKGDQCVNCHAGETNSDLVRTFAVH